MAFYRDVDQQLCQGDLIDDVPSIHLKQAPLGALRKTVLRGKREGWETLAYSPDMQTAGPKPDFKNGELIPAFCQISRAILLTHGCDIDNDRKHRLVALVRPLTGVLPEHQQIIRENRNFSLFYLPADDQRRIEEAYVDFRRLTSLAPELVTQVKRLASLTDDAVRTLQAHLFRFLTHREIVDDGQTRPAN